MTPAPSLDFANVAYLPAYSGDGYGYGGGCILVIGQLAFQFGEQPERARIAEQLARLWNAAQKQGDAR